MPVEEVLVVAEIDIPGEIFVLLALRDAFVGQEGVSIEINECPTCGNYCDDFQHFLVQQRFPAGGSDDGGASFIHRVSAVLHGKSLVQGCVGGVVLPATGAGEVAAEQRFQHQHQG